jgi:hypothetical protein
MEDDEFEKTHIQMLAAVTPLASTKSSSLASPSAAEKQEEDKEDNDDQ